MVAWNLALAQEALHILACQGGVIPLDGRSLTRLNDKSRLMVQLVLRSLGAAGHVPVSAHVWRDRADQEFGRVGGHVTPFPPSRCPWVAALLSTLAQQGLVSVVGGDANEDVFVKWKSEGR